MDIILVLPIFSIVIVIILLILFLTKNNSNGNESKIYITMIITNLVGLILELLCSYAAIINSTHPLISNTIFKVYLIYLITFSLELLYYEYFISSASKVDRKLNKLILFILLVSILGIAILPIELITKNDFTIRYTTGLSVYFTYFISTIIVFIMLYFNFKYLKGIKNKNIWAIYAFYVIVGIAMIIQYFSPKFLLVTSAQTLVILVMYCTLENPDAKIAELEKKARDAAETANKAKSDFLSSMSHEIRTPLNAIVGFSNGLIDNDKLDAESKEDVNNIIMASDSLLELVNGILDTSKIEAGKLEIIDICYNFHKIFDELVLLTKARLGEKPLEFNYSYDESIPKYLYGDATRVKQVILNLLTNSVKYTKEGYVDFRVNYVAKGDIVRLMISVEDSGIGIKKENIDKLFSKFERLGVEKDTTVEGTGLGLAITKKLVEMMNGKIVVQSVYGKGSKFTISLDQKIVTGEELEKIKNEENTKVENEIIDASGKKVLVVDDNNLNLKVAQRLLEAYKCNIECVSSGFDCIDKIASGEKYDLILLDDMMPKMSGSETLIKLKNIDSFNTPVVVLTANAISGMKEEYLKKGFNDYLSKPIEKQELNRVMKKYLC